MKKQIIKEIKDLLKKSGMAKKDFAKEMGVLQTTVSHWLRGDHGMSLPAYFRAKEILSTNKNK